LVVSPSGVTNISVKFISLDIISLIWFGCGLFIAGALEALLWKTPIFNYFNVPINQQLFGENKRWRGLITLPLTNLLSTYIMFIIEQGSQINTNNLITFADVNLWQYGLLTGLCFNLAELPNSFVKRRLKILPGDETNPVFFWVDHMDSPYGVLLLWWLYFGFPPHLIITGVAIAPLLFIAATWLRKKWHLK